MFLKILNDVDLCTEQLKLQNSRLTAEFGDTIKWIKEHPNDEQALKTFFTLLHKTNINVSTGNHKGSFRSTL